MTDIRNLYTGHIFRHEGDVWVVTTRSYSRKKGRCYVHQDTGACRLRDLFDLLIPHGTLVQPVVAVSFRDQTEKQAEDMMAEPS